MDKSLIAQLKNLRIDVSGIKENSICAWNNEHMLDTAAFFHWFTRYLNECNILEPSESEEYKFLVNKGVLNDECDVADIEKIYPDLFDLELNKSQIQIIESEYDALKEYERKLENQIEVNMEISKRIEKEMRRVKNKMDILNIKYEQTYEACLREAKEVDFGYSDLRMKVYDCLEYLNKDWSIFSTDNEKTIQKYKEGLVNVSRFCDNFGFNSTLELEQSRNAELETLERRLYDSNLYSYIASVKEKQLESELTFYKDFVSLEEMLINIDDQRYIQTESLELSKQINIDKSLELLQEIIFNFVRHHIDNLNIIKLEKTVFEAKKKSENVCEIGDVLTNILAYKDTRLNLYKIIDENMQAMDVFLREELLSIVNTDLRSCINRSELMKEKIEEQKDEQQKSVENQNKLIRVIVDLISTEHIDDITVQVFKNVVKKFYGTISDYEMQLFVHDIEIYRSKVNILERNNYFMKTHLKSESNNEIILCPLEYSLALCKLREVSKEADDIVRAVVQYRKSTDETLRGNKWLRISRQLWMYFLVNPRKVIEYLKEIAEENNKRISNQINTDNKIIHNAHMYMND